MKEIKLALLVFFVLMATSCKKNIENVNWRSELRKHGPMGDAYIAMSRKDCIGQCQWTRISNEVLRFEGIIASASFDEFMYKIDNDVTEIYLNSAGGSVATALKIANEIHKRNLKISVKGFCVSSCANYLFMSGREKEIDGILGFHGNAQALHKNSCKEFDDNAHCKIDTDEKSFFESLNMTNLLFDVTQSKDKGMQTGLEYIYYAPSKKTLFALGVKGIIGDQKQEYLLEMKKLYEEFGLVEFLIATDPNPTISHSLK